MKLRKMIRVGQHTWEGRKVRADFWKKPEEKRPFGRILLKWT
jgi:hypothetical protein